MPGCPAENIRTAAANFLAVEDLVVDTTTNNTLSGLVRRENSVSEPLIPSDTNLISSKF